MVQHNHIGAFEAKTHFSRLLERVASGEEITITRHGQPVAKLVPIDQSGTPAARAEAIARWRRTSETIRLEGLRVRDLIDEGRR